jgi:hypothetical protein
MGGQAQTMQKMPITAVMVIDVVTLVLATSGQQECVGGTLTLQFSGFPMSRE